MNSRKEPSKYHPPTAKSLAVLASLPEHFHDDDLWVEFIVKAPMEDGGIATLAALLRGIPPPKHYNSHR